MQCRAQAKERTGHLKRAACSALPAGRVHPRPAVRALSAWPLAGQAAHTAAPLLCAQLQVAQASSRKKASLTQSS